MQRVLALVDGSAHDDQVVSEAAGQAARQGYALTLAIDARHSRYTDLAARLNHWLHIASLQGSRASSMLLNFEDVPAVVGAIRNHNVAVVALEERTGGSLAATLKGSGTRVLIIAGKKRPVVGV